MQLLNKLSHKLLKRKGSLTQPEQAYDLWSSFYDDQPDNLMLTLDEQILSALIKTIDLENKICIDFGCGTGRHWNKILSKNPLTLTGLDVSSGMLNKLKEKFPEQEIRKIENNDLSFLLDSAVDTIFSTLTIAHIEDIDELFDEWNRITKIGADLIITDFHPFALLNGGKRNFNINGKQIQIKNFVHSLEKIRVLAKINGFSLVQIMERFINEEVKHYYINRNALNTYEQFRGMPIIYGMHFRKI